MHLLWRALNVAPLLFHNPINNSIKEQVMLQGSFPREIRPGAPGPPEALNPSNVLMVSLTSPENSSHPPVGGRLYKLLHAWRLITSYPWVLQSVGGFHIETLGPPVQHSIPPPIALTAPQRALVQQILGALALKGALEPSPTGGPLFP